MSIQPQRKEYHILIVDDDCAQQTALCQVLDLAGYTAQGFASGEEALKALRRDKFQLVITDLTMPGLGGIEFLQVALQIDPELVGIVMTGHGAIDTAIAAMKAGALDYILKPFGLSDITPIIERAIAVRHLTVENMQLQRSLVKHVAELECANAELEAFSQSISHDLRAPLRAISGFAQILELEHTATMSAEAQLLLGKISGGAKKMTQLIEDLLRFSYVNQQQLDRRVVDMNALAQEALAELSSQTSMEQIKIVLQPLAPVIGDAALLKQVYANLLSNAVKFSRHRQPAIVEIGCRSEPGQHIFFVRDNGAGFNPQYAGRLFGVFQRLHTSSEFEGTGIGLSLVQRIIRRHGGKVWAESTLGNGATFYFALPASDLHGEPPVNKT